MKDKPPASGPPSSKDRDADQPAPPERKLIGLFDLQNNSVDDVVDAVVEAMKAAGL